MKSRLLLVALLAACSTSPSASLYTEAEIQELKASFAVPLPAPSCARPVLRPAPADAVSFELAKRAELPAECAGMKSAIVNPSTPPAGPTDPQLSLLQADRAAECMTTVRALVRGAVSHPAVCALPYELDEPTDETMVALVVAKAGALDVFELAKTTPDEAMLVALDQLRFFHDLWRGHSTLAQAMVAIAAENIVLDRAALALGQTPVAWSNVEVIIHELDTLIASVPSMGEMLMGESIAVARDLGLDVLAAPNSTDAIGGRTHDNGASVLQMMRVLRERWASSCPVTASLRDCRTAFESLPEVTADAGTAREEMRAQLVKPGWTAETRRATRDKLVAMDREAFEAGLVSYADKLATPLVRLAVLRFQLEVTARKVCPTPDQLRAAPWKEILAPAPLGDTLRSDKTTTGYTLRAPAWMAREKQSWTVSCATESP